MRYLEFATASNFSFLRGASHPEELMVQAQAICLAGLGLCDRNSVAGVVRAHLAKREQNLPLRYHPGARLVFADGTPDILAYPRDRASWGRLTRLLTLYPLPLCGRGWLARAKRSRRKEAGRGKCQKYRGKQLQAGPSANLRHSLTKQNFSSGGFFVRTNSQNIKFRRRVPIGLALGLLISCPSDECSLSRRMEVSTLRPRDKKFAMLTY